MKKRRYTTRHVPCNSSGFTDLYTEEIKQAYTRVIYIAILIPILGYLTRKLSIGLWPLWWGIGAYIILTSVHLYFLKRFPHLAPSLRKIFAIFIDIVITTVIVFSLKDYGFIFSLLYLWISLGNGMRFGPRFLFTAMSLSMAGIVILYMASAYWREHIVETGYMFLATIILPLFMLRLMRRIHLHREQLKKLLEDTEYNALHDSLTGLANREAFNSELERYITEKKPFYLLFIDLDGFKKINDQLGHHSGDMVLKSVADRLNELCRQNPSLFVARLGGDEFVIIAPTDQNRMVELAPEILQSLSRPYLSGKVTHLSASIGISRYPDDATSASVLKRKADQAMYAVKQSAKNDFNIISRKDPANKYRQNV